MKETKRLNWNEIADIYDKHHSGRRARTLPMEQVLMQTKAKGLVVTDDEGYVYRAEKKENSMKEEPILRGTEAEAIRALDRLHEQLAHPESNQKEIDNEAADLLRTTFCFKHGIPLKEYADGGFDCPECEADAVLDINYPVSPNAGMF